MIIGEVGGAKIAVTVTVTTAAGQPNGQSAFGGPLVAQLVERWTVAV